MKVELKGDKLIITIDANTTNPQPSASGKTLTVATTNGNKPTEIKVKDKLLSIGVNAYIKNDDYKK